jgi:hypothetical protein
MLQYNLPEFQYHTDKKQIQIQRKKSSFHCYGQITIQENMGLADNNWQ